MWSRFWSGFNKSFKFWNCYTLFVSNDCLGGSGNDAVSTGDANFGVITSFSFTLFSRTFISTLPILILLKSTVQKV